MYFTCIRWDLAYISLVPQANEMAISNFRSVSQLLFSFSSLIKSNTEWWSDFKFHREMGHGKPVCSASRYCLSMNGLLVRYGVHNNQITVRRLISPINKKALPVLFLKLMKYSPVPLNSPLSALTTASSTKWSAGSIHLVAYGRIGLPLKKNLLLYFSKAIQEEFWKRKQVWFRPHGGSVG